MYTEEGPSLFKGLAYFILFAVGLLFLFNAVNFFSVNVSKSHGETKHGVDAIAVQQNCDKGNILGEYINPETGNTAICVEIEEDPKNRGRKYGVRILDEFGDEITAFIKDCFKFQEQLAKWLARQNFIPKQ